MESKFDLFRDLVDYSKVEVLKDDQILAVNNTNLRKAYKILKTNHEKFRSFSGLNKIVQNHIIDKTLPEKGEIKMVSGAIFPYLENESVDKFELGEAFEIDDITYVDFEAILLIGDEKLLLEKFLKAPEWNQWTLLPNDVFYQLVETGNVIGRDLISACVSNSQINAKCNSRNEELFRRLLLRDYGEKSEGNHREKYLSWQKTRLWVFGSGESGQLGLGLDFRDQIRPVMLENFEGIREAKCSNSHTIFLDTQGRVWTMGDASWGKLGRGGNDKSTQFRPEMIEGFEGIKEISIGAHHTAFLDALGQIWTFGNGDNGRLGHGEEIESLYPKRIENFKGIKQISCGGSHTAFLDVQGRIWTFGAGAAGMLGHGDYLDQLSPRMIEGFEKIKQISCGSMHTAFLDTDGKVWTFGFGENGELGHNNRESQFSPKMIQNFEDIQQISCGTDYTAFLDAQGQVWTFGSANYGQLGHGNSLPKQKPFMIQDFKNIQQISCGYGHTAFLDAQGKAWTFGDGLRGQLGRAETVNFTPKIIPGFEGIKRISCGFYSTMFIQ